MERGVSCGLSLRPRELSWIPQSQFLPGLGRLTPAPEVWAYLVFPTCAHPPLPTALPPLGPTHLAGCRPADKTPVCLRRQTQAGVGPDSQVLERKVGVKMSLEI